MSDNVIRVENLYKEYRLGVLGHGTLARDLQSWWARVRGKEDPNTKIGHDYRSDGKKFLALENVSFEVKQGEVLGIIGRNGAGKSTLLKILSRVTAPTKGTVKIKGRIASLLEVGTGFHPELTGRENIYLNGAILGMTKKEIDKKFDEIVDFAEIEKFIDTPVKRYSSGMYVRLAFAVAAHLEPEILLVDEVLAVGDASFQKKCLGKMGEVAKGGRTVLFVSHNMPMVEKLCPRGILLEEGSLVCNSDIQHVLNRYKFADEDEVCRTPATLNLPNLGLEIRQVYLNKEYTNIKPYMPLAVELEIYAKNELHGLAFNLTISRDNCDSFIFSTSTMPHNNFEVVIKPGLNRIVCHIKELNLCSGTYYLGLGVSFPRVETIFFEREFLKFKIEDSMIRDSVLPSIPAYGLVYLDHTWWMSYGQ